MKTDKPKEHDTPSVANIPGDPETAFDMVNKFGTYNIQPTADADHEFPAIAQGKSKDDKQ